MAKLYDMELEDFEEDVKDHMKSTRQKGRSTVRHNPLLQATHIWGSRVGAPDGAPLVTNIASVAPADGKRQQ